MLLFNKLVLDEVLDLVLDVVQELLVLVNCSQMVPPHHKRSLPHHHQRNTNVLSVQRIGPIGSMLSKLLMWMGPLVPEGVNAKWHNNCGVAVRDKSKITWLDWKSVHEDRKSEMWSQVQHIIRFPEQELQRAKKATMKTLCNIF